MPVPNDLSPEEEAEFAQFGVPSAGPGREPLGGEQQEGQQQEGQQQEGQQQEGQQRQTFHREDGRFASREEVEAGQARPSQGQQQTQQGQQQEGQQQGQQQEGQQQGQEGQQQGQEGQQQPDNRTVPLAALHQERQQRAQLAQRLQLAEARMNAMLMQQTNTQQGQQQQQQMPDINTDPAGYILALEQRLAQFEQTRTEEQQYQQIDNAINTDEATFAIQTPDYHQASDYYVQSRARELLQFYPPQEAQRLMLQEARQIAQESWKRGKSAAETVYGLAMARGYNPNIQNNDPNLQDPQFQGQQQGQQQPTQQGQQQQRGRAQEIVRSVQQGQQITRSLSGGAGGQQGDPNDLNAQALLNMSDAEFDKWLGDGSASRNGRFATVA
jgi:hypothetical protein